MQSEKLNMLINIYKNSGRDTAITDSEFRLIWSNSPEKFLKISLKKLGAEYRETNKNNILVDLSGLFVMAEILPADSAHGTDGYIIELNCDAANSEFERLFSEDMKFMSVVRRRVSEIVLTSELVRQKLEESEMYDVCETIGTQIQSCYKLLNAGINKAERDKYLLGMKTVETFNASELVNDVMSTCVSLMRDKKIKITYSCESGVRITCDEDKLMSVLMILIVNAVQNIDQESGEVSVRLTSTDEYCVLSVEDNGKGLNSEVLSEFLSSESTDIYAYNGLAIVKRFCRMFDCCPIVNSTPEKGTRISLRIPLEKKLNAASLKSRSSEYVANRFSPIYIYLSPIINIYP